MFDILQWKETSYSLNSNSVCFSSSEAVYTVSDFELSIVSDVWLSTGSISNLSIGVSDVGLSTCSIFFLIPLL